MEAHWKRMMSRYLRSVYDAEDAVRSALRVYLEKRRNLGLALSTREGTAAFLREVALSKLREVLQGEHMGNF
jgi:hypothetical protein